MEENTLENWEKIFDICFSQDEENKKLYYKNGNCVQSEGVWIELDEPLDLGTYFNCFSLGKWMDYTNLERLAVHMEVSGRAKIEIYSIEKKSELLLSIEETSGYFMHELNLDVLKQKRVEIIGIRVKAVQLDTCLRNGGYYGIFSHTYPVRIGINICTFKREKYVKRNLAVLKQLIEKNKNFSVTIVDNGQSLQGISGENIQVFPNRNFGGSGGFTRGMMEQVNQGVNTHILMMDDDVVIEPTALERVYKVYQHIKEERRQQIFGGAMLSIGNPTCQFENTAYWNGIRMISNGRDFDLTDKRRLYDNEHFPKKSNTYAAWWFCCIPIEVVKKNGYPLPLFIKGDDMEYGIRNHQEVMHMNGVGVWHEIAAKKLNPAINCFNDRNMMILNHYAEGCNRWTFMASAFARLGRRILHYDIVGVKNFELALRDYSGGFEEITLIGADEKFSEVRNYRCNKKILKVICSVIKMILYQFFNYNMVHHKYLLFRKERLRDQAFWRHYLRLE